MRMKALALDGARVSMGTKACSFLLNFNVTLKRSIVPARRLKGSVSVEKMGWRAEVRVRRVVRRRGRREVRREVGESIFGDFGWV